MSLKSHRSDYKRTNNKSPIQLRIGLFNAVQAILSSLKKSKKKTLPSVPCSSLEGKTV